MEKTKRKKRGRGSRYDAELIPGRPDLTAIFPYLFKRRCDSLVYFNSVMNVEKTLEYIEKKKESGGRITFFQIVLIAMIRTLRERPGLNRYIAGRRVYQRNNISVNFVAKQDFSEGATESNVFLQFSPEESYQDILKKVNGEIKSVKQGKITDDGKLIALFMKLPRFVLRLLLWLLDTWDFYIDTPKLLRGIDPLRCSLFIANLGSLGVEAVYHHLFEWGNCSIFAAIGKIKPVPWVEEDNTIKARKAVEIKFTVDERVCDGFYLAKSLELLQNYIQNPELLGEVAGSERQTTAESGQ